MNRRAKLDPTASLPPILAVLQRFRASMDDQDRRETIRLVHETHGDAVRGICRRILIHEDAVDEAYFAILTKAYNALDKLDDPLKLKEWIKSIAYNHCFTEFKSRDLEQRLFCPFDERAYGPGDSESGPSEEELQMLHECLQKLDDKHRSVVMLRYLCDGQKRTFAHLGQMLHENEDTLQKRTATALKWLRKCLERKGVLS